MKFIAIPFVAIIPTIFFMNSGYGMGSCDVFQCEDQFKRCKLNECGSVLGFKKHRKCVKTKCQYAYDDCQKSCKDEDEDEDEEEDK